MDTHVGVSTVPTTQTDPLQPKFSTWMLDCMTKKKKSNDH